MKHLYKARNKLRYENNDYVGNVGILDKNVSPLINILTGKRNTTCKNFDILLRMKED